MKIATDIDQSRKLAKILPLDSADMFYYKDIFFGALSVFNEALLPRKGTEIEEEKMIPAWSLSALLAILHYPSLHKTISGWRCDTYRDDNKHIMYGESKNNPVDACYEMIIKLHELNLL